MKRVASVDIFRALTMLLMLWVNDYAWMDGIPHWMLHAPTHEDMLGLADLAFPSFLFCMGMSIPLAVESRLKKGEGFLKTALHVLLRTFALLLMGVFDQNVPSEWSTVYTLIAVCAFFLVWNKYPERGKDDSRRFIAPVHRAVGIAALIGLAVSVWPMKTGWWGILGLIGWAYLFSSILYLAFRKFRKALPLVWLAVLSMVILSQTELHIFAGLPGGWVHTGLAFSGLMCTCLTRRVTEAGKPKSFPLWALAGAVLMFAGFLLCHPHWIISKNIGTPTWMFLCLAIDMVLMAVLYFVADYNGKVKWARPIKAAGVATLTCYSLPYIWYSVRSLLGVYLPASFTTGVAGLAKAMVFSFVIIWIAELLGKINVRLKI